LLRENGIEPEIIEYLKEPLDEAGITGLLTRMDMEARDLLRTGEAEYKDFGLSDKSLSSRALIAAMASHPRLIQRPIVASENGVVLGRPTENILEVI